jgi:hypothetical protein
MCASCVNGLDAPACSPSGVVVTTESSRVAVDGTVNLEALVQAASLAPSSHNTHCQPTASI